MNNLIYTVSFIVGACFGSFATMAIPRLHNRIGGWVMGRSHCPHCRHHLGASDLVPLLSWIINRGKCRFCKKKISVFYPSLELTMGLAFLGVVWTQGFGHPWLLAFYLFLTFIFVMISFYDIEYQEIPDEISLPTIAIAGIVGWAAHLHTLKSLAVGFLIPVLFFGSLFLFSRGRWLGGGDVRVGAIMGFVLGFPQILLALFLAYLTGSIFSIFGLATGKFTRKTPIPFGPFLFLGTYVALLWGERILAWYVGLI